MKKNIFNIMSLLVMALMGLSLAACSEDDYDTNQYKGGVSLNVYGPQPVMRGGTLRFLGSNLDQIGEIILPENFSITNIDLVKSGVPGEIRITVPKDGTVEGFIKLIAKNGTEITTKTELTYSEPIIFEAFSPASVMPGETLTITGDYLNLVHMVAFTEDVYVSEEDFVSHDRYAIEVVVPEEARTGRVSLYTEDITKKVYDEEGKEIDLSYNIIESEDILNVGTPTIAKLASPRGEAAAQGTIAIKQGETLTITGEYLSLVASLTFGDEGNIVEVADFTVSEDGKTLTLALPAEAPDGDVNLVCRSGVEVPVGLIETVAPSNLAAAPAPVKVGQTLTISGSDLDVVATVEFPNVGEATAFTLNNGAIEVVVPETAQEGDITLAMANGKSVTVVYTLVKPTVTGYDNNPVSAGGALTIQGTNLDLVTGVQFGDGSDVAAVEAAADGTTLTLTVPMNAQTGKPTLLLANGTTVEGLDLTVEEAVFCYATELPGEDDELKAGGTLTITVANGDKLTGVQINSTACQWILTGEDKNQLIVGIPETATAVSKLRLVSSNGEITYDISVIPATSVTKKVWTGLTQLTWGDGGRVIIPASAFEDVPAGAIITFSYSQVDQQWDQAQVNYGDWSGIDFTEGGEGLTTFNKTLVPTDVYGWFSDGILNRETSMVLTQEILDNIQARKQDCENVVNAGIIIQGSGLTFSGVTVSYENSLETTIWSGEWTCSGWGGNQDLAWGGYDWSTVKANATVRFYYHKIDASAWGCISLRHGNSWGALPAPIPGQYDFADGETFVETTFTAAVLQDIVDNGGLVLTGDNYVLTKVTIE